MHFNHFCDIFLSFKHLHGENYVNTILKISSYPSENTAYPLSR